MTGPRHSASAGGEAGSDGNEAAAGGHTAIVTGANHGIGAATALALARGGCAVLCSFWRVRDPADAGIPQAYRDHRAGGADAVVAEIEAAGGRAVAAEADLSDAITPSVLFDIERQRRSIIKLALHLSKHPSVIPRLIAFAKRITRARGILTNAIRTLVSKL